MSQLLAIWWIALSSFVPTACSLVAGNTGSLTLLAAASIVLLLLGLALAAAWRVRQLLWLPVLLLLGLLASPAIFLANSVLGWLGMLFAVLGGGIAFIVAINVFAGMTDRRLPVWLVGLSMIAFAIYGATLGGAFDSLVL